MSRRLVSGCAVAAVVGLLAAGCGATGKTARPGPTTSLARTGGTAAGDSHGPFAVGVRTETFTDTTRTTPANGTEPERPNRILETIIEYPAQGSPDPTVEQERAAAASGRFPVALFVHGFSAHADNPYLHYWAAAGFIAAAIKFPLTNTDTPGGPTQSDAVNEPADVRFVLSQMAHLPRQDADLQRIIDASRVGVMGQSLGATVALALGYTEQDRDPRIKAVVPVSAGCVACPGSEAADATTGGPSVPVMFIHGTADPFAPIALSAQEYEKAPAPKFFLSLIGAKHVQFGPPWEPIAAQATIDFFNRYLKQEGDGLRRLAVDANVAEVASLQQTPG